MELRQDPPTVSGLIGMRVRDSDGKALGHVFELRARHDRDGFPVIDQVLIGRRGLWKRLRGPGGPEGGIPWEHVLAIEEGALTVKNR